MGLEKKMLLEELFKYIYILRVELLFGASQ